MPVERTIIEWQMNETTRRETRAAVLQTWANEEPGTANNYRRYRYNVETLADGRRVYLHRPARLNKGCDFEVFCEWGIRNHNNGNPKRPTQNDLVDELGALASLSPVVRTAVLQAIRQVYECANVQNTFVEAQRSVPIESHLRLERALKLAKWLFIEQDITDWNTSGRAMLMNGIEERLA
jgi:hypothetical protein